MRSHPREETADRSVGEQHGGESEPHLPRPEEVTQDASAGKQGQMPRGLEPSL